MWKKFQATVTALALATVTISGIAQTGFRNSAGQVLPHVTSLVSNDVFSVGTTGAPISPTNKNVRWGQIQNQNRSDLDLKHGTAALDTAPVNPQEAKRIRSKFYNREKVTLGFVGDSVGQDVQPVIESALIPFMGRAGAVGQSTPSYLGNYFTISGVGTTTTYPVGLNGVFWGPFIAMGNAATVTASSSLSNGIAGDTIGIAWISGGYTGAGSMLVETQAFGGTWGTLRTLSSAAGTFTMMTTNITVPVENYLVRLTATGSNMPVGVAIRDNRSGAGFQSSSTTTAGVSPIGIMQTCGSNNVAQYVLWQNCDIYFYKAERQTTITNELPWWERLISNTIPNCDIAYIAYHDGPDPGIATLNRNFMADHCRRYGRILIDNLAESRPYASSTNKGLYSVDGVHLENVGKAVLHSRVPSQIGIGLNEMISLGFSLPSGPPQTNDLTKANLSGGNNFSGQQNFSSLVMVSNSFGIRGSGTELQLWAYDDPTAAVVRIFSRAANNPLTLAVSTYQRLLSVSNISGRLSLSTDPFYYWTQGSPAMGQPSAPYFYHGAAYFLNSNTVAKAVPTAPDVHGQACFWNSNGVVYLLTSGIGNTWTATNKLAP